MIRQFDSTTPIVSMTSNSGPNDVMTYFSHGKSSVRGSFLTSIQLLTVFAIFLQV